MERSKYLLAAFCIYFIAFFQLTGAGAQRANNELVYNSFIKGDLKGWLPEIQKLEGISIMNTSTQLDLLNLYYGYTAWLYSADQDDQGDEYLEKAEELINMILKQSPNSSTTYAYKAAFIGFELGQAPYKAMILGPKSLEYISTSLSLEPNNIQGNIEKANAAYYTPSLFGGSKNEAINAYKKAIHLIELDGKSGKNWLYLNCLTMLAQAYQKTDQDKLAKITYLKILKTEPNFKWVKEELYPEFIKNSRI